LILLPNLSGLETSRSLFIVAQIFTRKDYLTFRPARAYIHLRGFPNNKKRHGRLMCLHHTSPALR